MSIDRSPWLIALAAIVSIAAAALAVVALGRMRGGPTPDLPALRLALTPPEELTLGGRSDYPFGLSLSPDGRRVVFPAGKSGPTMLWIRDLATGETQPLPGTDEAVLPFWSPDGRAIAFFADGKLRVITLEDASVRDLAEARSPRGGAWHPGGDIVFAPDNDGSLLRRQGSTGNIESFTTLDTSTGESSHRFPAFVDRGRSLVFFVRADSATRQGIWMASFDQPAARRRLIGNDASAVAVGDVLVYSQDRALVAQPIDVDAQALGGQSIVLGTPVGHGPLHQLFVTATNDLLIYGAPSSTLRELHWIDRAGSPAGLIGEPMDAWDVRISPGETTVAVTRVEPQLGTLDIWAYDGGRLHPRRISSSIDIDETPVWSRDGHRVAWVTGRRTVTARGALATLPEQTLGKFDHAVRVTDWSPDQQWIVLTGSRPTTHDDVLLLPAEGEGTAVPYVQSTFNEVQGVVSPDGRWLAYASDESGRYEIYVDSFPTPGTRARLTSGGGGDPRWRADGAELFFRRGSEVHAVSRTGEGWNSEALASERLFEVPTEMRAYDVSGDGQRFLVNVPKAETARPPLTVLVNVRSLLRFAP
jgi:eukaryotic-like serine/threonine-protein kinase